jgi:mono/diheme cytochrome c family protein
MKELSTVAVVLLLAFSAVAGCRRSQAKRDDAQAEAARTFAMVCARCHGPDGSGASLTPALAVARNFRDAAFQKERSDEDLARVIRDGKGGMPPFANAYTPEQVAELVRLIRSFNPEKKR